MPETSARWLSNELENLARGINPDDPASVEFHAAEIFSGKKPPWSSIKDKSARIQIIKNVLGVLSKAYAETSLFACAIHKNSYPQEDPVIRAYEDLSSRFSLNIGINNSEAQANNSRERVQHRGLIVLDKSSSEQGLQSLALEIRRSGNRWGQQLRSLIEVPLFVDSRASRIVQLADHVAYAVFRRYQSGDLTYFNCIENRFYQRDGVIHGLVHRQIINLHCTCPACISRR